MWGTPNRYLFNDAVTADETAGIGAEFESPFFYFEHQDCSIEDTNAARKKVIDGRTGKNWQLTADTGASGSGGKLYAEYILDGRNIKVGRSGDESCAQVAKSAADDLVSVASRSSFPFFINKLVDHLEAVARRAGPQIRQHRR